MRYATLFITVILAAMLSFSCGPKNGAQAKSADPSAAISVEAAVVQSEEIRHQIEITGTLAPVEESTVSFEVDGRLAELRVDLGDTVRKGDPLARIYPEEYDFRRVQAEAEQSAAEADFKRLSELKDKNLASQQQVDEAQRRVNVAKSAADLTRKKLADCTLRAPFDGNISKRLINPGEYIRTGTAAFQIVRITPLKFKGEVPERYSQQVKKEDSVQAFIESRSESLSGRIVRISPSVDSSTRSYAIEAEIQNPDGQVKPGSFARLSILTQVNDKSLTIPETAIMQFAGNPRVFVIENGTAKERVIEVAGKVKARAIVAKGLNENETVAISGVDLLTDGRAVTIR